MSSAARGAAATAGQIYEESARQLALLPVCVEEPLCRL